MWIVFNSDASLRWWRNAGDDDDDEGDGDDDGGGDDDDNGGTDNDDRERAKDTPNKRTTKRILQRWQVYAQGR